MYDHTKTLWRGRYRHRTPHHFVLHGILLQIYIATFTPDTFQLRLFTCPLAIYTGQDVWLKLWTVGVTKIYVVMQICPNSVWI